jgi:hypothetical protein
MQSLSSTLTAKSLSPRRKMASCHIQIDQPRPSTQLTRHGLCHMVVKDTKLLPNRTYSPVIVHCNGPHRDTLSSIRGSTAMSYPSWARPSWLSQLTSLKGRVGVFEVGLRYGTSAILVPSSRHSSCSPDLGTGHDKIANRTSCISTVVVGDVCLVAGTSICSSHQAAELGDATVLRCMFETAASWLVHSRKTRLVHVCE